MHSPDRFIFLVLRLISLKIKTILTLFVDLGATMRSSRGRAQDGCRYRITSRPLRLRSSFGNISVASRKTTTGQTIGKTPGRLAMLRKYVRLDPDPDRKPQSRCVNTRTCKGATCMGVAAQQWNDSKWFNVSVRGKNFCLPGKMSFFSFFGIIHNDKLRTTGEHQRRGMSCYYLIRNNK